MRIRHHLLIMLLICVAGGVASTFGLAQMYRRLDVQQHQVGADSLALSGLERLKDGVDRLLVTTDLAIGGGETYLLAGARKQVDQLLALTEALREEALLRGSQADLETLTGAFQSFISHIEGAGGSSDTEPNSLSNRLVEAYDADSMLIVEAVEEIAEVATQHSQATQKILQQNRAFAHRLVWGCTILYALLVAGAWQWTWVRVVKPLQGLTDAAHHAMIDDEPFVFADSGPRETRQLGRTVREFVNSLETKVAERTLELRNQTELLKKEIIEREKAQQEKQQAESRLRQAQKMEAIGTLAGGIAHDFNNILFAILGYARLALKGSQEDAPARRHVSKIVVAANRAKDLVGQILTFSRLSNQPAREVDVADIVNETLDLLRTSLPENIEIKQVIETKSSTILADPTGIHQVVMNLCTNAGHAMEWQRGVLEVGLANTEIETAQTFGAKRLEPGSYVTISIKDSGCGMDEALIERIFEPFFTTKGVGKGTGLGLAMVHGIVEEYDGLITIESEVGKGTCFHVFFPKVPDKSTQRAPAMETPQGRGEKILIVDDEECCVDMMRQSLEGLGYRVTGKTDGREALETFRAASQAFDLVVTDQMMPGMTGIQLAEAILDLRPDVPVLLCTGYSKEVLAPPGRKWGIADVIYKPVDVEAMGGRIRKLLDAKGALA